MGRKEKEKILRIKEAAAQPTRSASDGERRLEQKILELRSEISQRNQQYIETIVRITKELTSARSDINILMRALPKTGAITQQIVDDVMAEMKAEHAKFIDPVTGKMRGEPVVTQYNCDFTIAHPGYKIVEVKAL